MRAIDGDALIERIKDYPYGYRGMIKNEIEQMPTLDVVPTDYHDKCMKVEIEKRMALEPIVRCKDCIHLHDHDCPIDWGKTDDDYCSFGERKDEVEE